MNSIFNNQMLTYLMVSRVAQLCPGAVLTKLDKLVEPLKLTVTTKVRIKFKAMMINILLVSSAKIYGFLTIRVYLLQVKANAVKQEYEKQDELKRSAMRAVASLMMVPGAGKQKQ